eukprot:CAMPEP_0174912982 /NCGR_PEP_ID=MMETSP0167-20121228/80072_1 /TAXON_ID=38298 /ORGANISM="Rhodella maculata, Strain CCMP736" /LENGTH=33 /DNA_ID= /DNA_START= /DNA_END= /DNA_ORIENTATION=
MYEAIKVSTLRHSEARMERSAFRYTALLVQKIV